MKKLIFKTGLFVLPFLIIGIFLEGHLRKIPNDYDIKQLNFHAAKDDLEVLILGNSHAFYGLNPIFFDKEAFNFAYVAQSLPYDQLLLEKHISKLPNLDLILLNISYPSFFFDLLESPEAYRGTYYYTRYGLKNLGSLKYKWEITGIRLKENLSFLRKYWLRGKINTYTDENGWGSNYSFVKKQDLEQTGIKYAKMHTFKNAEAFIINKSALESLMKLAEDNRINIILFSTPIHFHYRENMNDEQWTKAKKVISELEYKYGNVKYLDFSEDERFIDDDFFDADHLNNVGAEKLSKLLNELLNQTDLTEY